MKPNKLFLMLGLLSASACAFWSCDDDDDWGRVDGAAPVVTLTTDHIKSAIGRSFTVTGNLQDNDGIASIRLYCPELFFNKTIDIIDIYGEPQKSYNLNYSFPISKEEKGDNFNVEVTVTDVCGQTTTQKVRVTMDGDFELPSFATAPGDEVTLIMKARTSYNLNLSVTDDQGLDHLYIQLIDANNQTVFEETVSCQGKAFDYSKKIAFENVEATYTLKLVVVDKEGKQSEKKSTIVVSSEVPDYPNLWLSDVQTAAELNADIFGVPQYVRHAYEDQEPVPYTYEARYYNQKSGTKVWFLGQKSDFGPVCYGTDLEDVSLLSDDEETMQAITLNEAGVYYKITINIKNYSLNIETYPVSEALAAFRTELYDKPETFLVWDQWYINFQLGYLNDGPGNIKPFAQDATNPNLFFLEEPLTFDADNNLKLNDDGTYTTNFMIHNFHPGGWWDVVCYKPSSKDDPEFWPFWGNFSQEQLNTPNWTEWPGYKGPNDWCKVVVPSSKFGDYRLIFDAHTEQAKLVPAK